MCLLGGIDLADVSLAQVSDRTTTPPPSAPNPHLVPLPRLAAADSSATTPQQLATPALGGLVVLRITTTPPPPPLASAVRIMPRADCSVQHKTSRRLAPTRAGASSVVVVHRLDLAQTLTPPALLAAHRLDLVLVRTLNRTMVLARSLSLHLRRKTPRPTPTVIIKVSHSSSPTRASPLRS